MENELHSLKTGFTRAGPNHTGYVRVINRFYRPGPNQGNNARKVNCGCVYSASTLKPVLGGICKQEDMHQCSFSIRGG